MYSNLGLKGLSFIPTGVKRNDEIRSCKNNYYIVFLSKTLKTGIASVYQQVKLVPKRAKI